MAERKKVLITGAGGAIGSALSENLRDRYSLRLLHHSRMPESPNEADEVMASDATNFEAMLSATSGMDAVVHLALAKGRAGQTSVEHTRLTIEQNIPGDYNIFEACRINSVPTIVYASTNHVSGLYEQDKVLSKPEAPIRPDSVYGAGKAFGAPRDPRALSAHRQLSGQGCTRQILRARSLPMAQQPGHGPTNMALHRD